MQRRPSDVDATGTRFSDYATVAEQSGSRVQQPRFSLGHDRAYAGGEADRNGIRELIEFPLDDQLTVALPPLQARVPRDSGRRQHLLRILEIDLELLAGLSATGQTLRFNFHMTEVVSWFSRSGPVGSCVCNEFHMSKKRVDVHTHLIPPFWANGLKSHGGDPSGWGSPEWSPELLLRFMDDEDIEVSILSLTAPGVEGWKGSERCEMTRRVNDYGADQLRTNPSRFGYLATLALPDVDAALAELNRAYDELHVDGVVLHSNFDGIYLADQRFDPVWTELDRRSATVFVHPTMPPMHALDGVPGPLTDYPADTTRCALDLVLRGHPSRFPSVKIILSHGGGFLPYVATRFAELSASLHKDRSAEQFMADMQRFYFDTALVAGSGLPSLRSFTSLDHVVFGTDYPYASERVSKTFTANLDAADLSTEQFEVINTGARRLFSRLQGN